MITFNKYMLATQIVDPAYLPKASSPDIVTVINIIFGIIGAIAVLMVVYSGIQIIISAGNAEKVATARKSIIISIVGLIVIIFAQIIVSFVLGRL